MQTKLDHVKTKAEERNGAVEINLVVKSLTVAPRIFVNAVSAGVMRLTTR